MADLCAGCTGPPDEACVIPKCPRVHAHLYVVELGVEQHERVGPKSQNHVNKCIFFIIIHPQFPS